MALNGGGVLIAPSVSKTKSPRDQQQKDFFWHDWWKVVVMMIGFLLGDAGPVFAEEIVPEPLDIQLFPREVILTGAGSSQTFLVMGTFEEGVQRDLTSLVELVLSKPELATVAEGNRVFSTADGELLLTVVLAGKKATATIKIENSQLNRPMSYSRDIEGILMRRGCNGTNCHGAVPGQGGFKLSINGSYPRDDYQWIVEGGHFEVLTSESGEKKPRVDLETPEKSLLLLKATEQVSHEGGERFDTDSPEYAKIIQWISAGARYESGDETRDIEIKKLEVYPKHVTLDLNSTQQILVTAHWSDGYREDVTREVVCQSNNDTVLEVSPAGIVSGKGLGETDILIQAPGKVASVRLAVIAEALASYPHIREKNFVDQHVFAKLRELNVVPSELSSDGEFLRRICLDLTGTLPPPNRVREFLASTDPQKRDKLIEILLNSPEFDDFLFYRYSELFRWHSGATQLPKDTQLYGEWLRQSVVENKPYDQLAIDRIAPEGYDGPTRFYYQLRNLIPPEDVIAEHVRVYRGRRLDCARCHDHPFEAWSQDQFWGMAAFYSDLVDLRRTVMDNSVLVDVAGTGKQVIHPRTKEVVQPQFLDGVVVSPEDRKDLRMKLAESIVSHPYFAETFVNRVWDWFFGKGIVDLVDDFRSNNPPSHPELIRALAADFQEHGYDVKHLMRVIVRSRTYQLSGTPNATNDGDRHNFSHALPRPLEAAVLLDALSQVTAVPNVFTAGDGAMPSGTRAIALLPNTESEFLKIFNRNERKTLPEQKPEPTLAQSLHMLTGETFSEKIAHEDGRLSRLIESGMDDRYIITKLYLASLSRYPTPNELSKLGEMIQQRTRREAFSSLMWALVCSRQFAHNHVKIHSRL